MKEQLINELIKFLISVIGLVSGYVLLLLGNFLNEKKKLVAKQGKSEQYNYALTVARGLYTLFEKQFADIEKAGNQKKDAMENYLVSIIPELSKEELDSIIEKVWKEFNDNVIQPIITPVEQSQSQPTPIETLVDQATQETIAEMHNDEPVVEQPQA